MPELPPNQSQPETETDFFEKISPTAQWPAFVRGQFTDIPFAAEVFKELNAKMRRFDIERAPSPTARIRIPLFEARYKFVSKVLAEEHATQIFEIASGFSPRGLSMMAASAYVAFDLPAMSKEMKRIVRQIEKKSNTLPRNNLFFEAGNALDSHDVQNATRHFDAARPVAVVTEGFMGYLDLDQKRKVAENIFDLLKRFGGVWVSPAIPPPRRERTTRSDRGRSRELYESLGFSITERSLMEVECDLVSPAKLDLSEEEMGEVRMDFAYASSLVMRI